MGAEAERDPNDDETWNALVRLHDRRVVVYLVSRGLRPCEARELAQEVWMRLVTQHRAGKLERLELPGLALAQARFLHLESIRRHKAVVPLEEAREVRTPAGEHRALDRLRLGRALDALSQCSERDRTLFETAYGPEAPSHGSLAERFGISLQRTRQVLCTVRAMLRTVLEEE